jgi:hypothetical protein
MNQEQTLKEWDLVIEPQSSLLELNLKDVWRYRDLLWLLVKRDFVSFYKQTILGPLWFFIQPLFTTIIFTFIFGNLAGLSTDGLPQPLFYMAGITAWNYFADCLTKTSTVFRDNANIFGKVYFPRLIMPLSIVVSNLVRFAVQMLLFFMMIGYYAFTGAIDDGLNTTEGAFLVCTFWLVDAYVAIGRLDDAEALFERLLSIRNDLGLLAEEYDPVDKRQVGNFPQAFSHIGLINSAFNLTRARGKNGHTIERG